MVEHLIEGFFYKYLTPSRVGIIIKTDISILLTYFHQNVYKSEVVGRGSAFASLHEVTVIITGVFCYDVRAGLCACPRRIDAKTYCAINSGATTQGLPVQISFAFTVINLRQA